MQMAMEGAKVGEEGLAAVDLEREHLLLMAVDSQRRENVDSVEKKVILSTLVDKNKQNIERKIVNIFLPITEMPTIPIFVESFCFSRPISALRSRTSKFRKITILQAKMVPDKIMDVTLTYTPVKRTFYLAIDYYT